MRDIKDNAPNEITIKQLERLLESAKSGHLRTIVTITGWSDDTWSHGWSVDDRSSRRRMLGESVLTHHDLVSNQLIADGDSAIAMALEDY